jgi:hypothetical protein
VKCKFCDARYRTLLGIRKHMGWRHRDKFGGRFPSVRDVEILYYLIDGETQTQLQFRTRKRRRREGGDDGA